MDYSIIKQTAKEKGITIKEMAESIGMTEQGYHKAARNNTLTVAALEKIAVVLQVSVFALLGATKLKDSEIEALKQQIQALKDEKIGLLERLLKAEQEKNNVKKKVDDVKAKQ